MQGMTLEHDLAAAEESARRNLEKSLALESALFVLHADIAEFLSGKLDRIPKRNGIADGIYHQLNELSGAYRELEELREFLPLKSVQNEPAQWYAYGKRLARTGAPAHAQEFLWKAFYGTMPARYSWFGTLLFFTGESVFSHPGEKQLRLESAAELVPVLYGLGQKAQGDRLCAHMMRLVAEGKDKALIKQAHIALGSVYVRLKNEKFAEYHALEASKIQ